MNGCEMEYQRATNTLRLRDNLALTWIGPVTVGSGSLTNSQCTVNSATSSRSFYRRDTHAEPEHRVQCVVNGRKDDISERVGYSQPCRWMEGRRLIYRLNRPRRRYRPMSRYLPRAAAERHKRSPPSTVMQMAEAISRSRISSSTEACAAAAACFVEFNRPSATHFD